MGLVKKLVAAGAALSLVATPVLAASTAPVQNAAQELRVGTRVNTTESESLFGLDDTMTIILGLLLIGGGVGLAIGLSDSSP